jgi:hypothetical protein
MKSLDSSNAGSWLAALLAVAVAGLFAGCSSCKPGKGPGKPQAYNLHINLGQSLKDSSVVVDLIAANPYDVERLKTYSVNKYWQPGDALRRDLPKMDFSFVSGTNLNRTLNIHNGVWNQWFKSGVQYLVVMADLPGVYEEGKAGSQDPRRQIVPVCKCYWPSGTKDLTVEVQASGVRVVTAPRLGQTLPPGW